MRGFGEVAIGCREFVAEESQLYWKCCVEYQRIGIIFVECARVI